MQVVNLGEKIDCPIVVCLGYFGCMHQGHIALLKTAKLRAEQTDSKVALFTFSNNHLKVLGQNDKSVYTFDERLTIYQSLGIDYVLTLNFDRALRQKTGRMFLDMFSCYKLRGVVCGFDHRIGSDRLDCLGIKNYLEQTCPVDIVDEVRLDGQKISTTLVRNYLDNCKIQDVNRLLCEPFFITGSVARGRGVGRTLGFPTANLIVSSEKLLPRGVFGGSSVINGKAYKCIVNIGNIPTFDIDRETVEAHLIGFDGDIYLQQVKISLDKYLRKIKKFDTASELSAQLQIDKENVLND